MTAYNLQQLNMFTIYMYICVTAYILSRVYFQFYMYVTAYILSRGILCVWLLTFSAGYIFITYVYIVCDCLHSQQGYTFVCDCLHSQQGIFSLHMYICV